MWSPSHVNKFLECPVKWSLGRQGVPEVREKWSPGLIIGTALHAALAEHFRGPLSHTRDEGLEDIVRAGIVTNWPPEEYGFEPEVVVSRAVATLHRVLDKTPEVLADGGRVVAVEEALGPGERELGTYPGTADLITEHDGGRYLGVTDWKTHWSLDDPWVEKELSETERNFQLHQYAWFARQKYGKPVAWVRKVVARCLPGPKAWLHTVPVTTQKLDKWHKGAEVVWAQMTAGVVYPNWQSCRKYGKCGYYFDCHGEV